MPAYIEIDDESSALLDKFCNERIRSTDIGALMARIIRPWYMLVAKSWVKNPKLIPKLEKIGEKKTHAIAVRDVDATPFRNTLKKFNEKMKMEIGETELVSWLAKMFIEMYRLEQKNEGYKMKYGHLQRV